MRSEVWCPGVTIEVFGSYWIGGYKSNVFMIPTHVFRCSWNIGFESIFYKFAKTLVTCNTWTRDCEFSHWPRTCRSVRISRMTKKPVDSLAGFLSWGGEESLQMRKFESHWFWYTFFGDNPRSLVANGSFIGIPTKHVIVGDNYLGITQGILNYPEEDLLKNPNLWEATH